MAKWKNMNLAGMFSGINPAMLKSLKAALKMSVEAMEKQVDDINKYIDTMIDPIIKLLEEKVKELLDFMEAFNVGIGCYAFDSIKGKEGAQKLAGIFNTIDFMGENDLCRGTILLIKTPYAKQLDKQKKALEKFFPAGNSANKWNKMTLGDLMPFFNPADAASSARQIVDKFEEILIKLKEKKEAMLEFIKKELQTHIDDANAKIEKIEEILASLKTAGLYLCTFEGIKGKAKLVKDIEKSLEEKEGSPAPQFTESDSAAGLILMLNADEVSYQVMSDLLKMVLK